MGSVMTLTICFAPFDMGSYSINSEPVSGPEFLRRIGILWAALGLIDLAIAIGLYQERPWTRILMMWWWLLFLATGMVLDIQDGQSPVQVIAMTLVGVAIAAGYLFAKQNVVDYFRYLGTAADEARRGRAGPGLPG